ncbi:MAG: hypothetical protein AAGK47_02560 [Bacteroidota bacterium]
MSRLKNIGAVALLFLITLFAQDAIAQRGQRGDMLEQLKRDITLTTDQETQIRAIVAKYKVRADDLRAETASGTSREAVRALRKAQRAEVQKVLTPEQTAILKEKRASQRANRGEKWSEVDKKGLKSELKAYHTKNIKPVLATERVQLESKISAADRATLERLRQVIGNAKKEPNAKGQRLDKTEMVNRREAFEAKYADEFATLKTLTQKYDTELEKIRLSLQPKMKQWKQDTEGITKQYLQEAEVENARPAKRKRDRVSNILNGERGKGAFLLMSPAA